MVVKSDKNVEIMKDNIIIVILLFKCFIRVVIKMGNRFVNKV